MPRSSDNWNNDKSTSDSDGFGYSHSSDGGGDAWGDAGERSNGGVPLKYGYQPNDNSQQSGSGSAAAKDANYDVTETTEFQPSPPGASAAQQGQYGQTYGQSQNGAQGYGQGYAQGYGVSQQGQYQQPNQYSTQYGQGQQYGQQYSQGQQYGQQQYDQQQYPGSAAYGSRAGSASVGASSGSSGFPLGKVLALAAAVVALVAVVGLFFFGREQGWFNTSNNEASSSQSREVGQDNGNAQNPGNQGQNTTAGQNGSNGNDGQASDRDTSGGGDDSSKRPQYPDLPSGVSPANNSAENNEPAGNLNNVYVLGGLTTKPFARNVRDAYVRNYLSTGELNTTVKGVYSPDTKLTYDMDCVDNGQYVRCDGGNNAVVIID